MKLLLCLSFLCSTSIMFCMNVIDSQELSALMKTLSFCMKLQGSKAYIGNWARYEARYKDDGYGDGRAINPDFTRMCTIASLRVEQIIKKYEK